MSHHYVDAPPFSDRRRFTPPPPPLDEDEEEVTRAMATSSVHSGPSPPPMRRSRSSLGELFKKVGDATKGAGESDDDGDDSSSSVSYQQSPHIHHIIELHDMGGNNNSNGQNHQLPRTDVDFFQQRRLPFVLAFSDLTYSVGYKDRKSSLLSRCVPYLGGGSAAPTSSSVASPPRKHTKTLLDSISGSAHDGEILAVLGASGSGKSTLIDALASRISRDSLRGTITLNGEHLESRLLRAISAYVMQDDLLFPMLTVEETLTYAAEFRLPSTLSPHRKRERVRQLIDQLGLRSAAGTIIGDEGHRGVSGGERRRVSIGIDIVHDPIILFLDEPTSGLDSTSAFMVVEVLRKIAASGSIVIMSIHQPSFRILGLLDQLIFLSKGRTVYSGTPDGLQPYLSEFGHPIPDNENRTEFALDLIRELEMSPSGPADLRRLVEFHKHYAALHGRPTTSSAAATGYGTVSLKDAISASISRGKLVSGATDPVPGAALAAAHNNRSSSNAMKTFANPFWVEMGVLTRRSFTNTRRMPELFAIRLGAVLVTGFILATIFWRLDATPKGIQERLGFFAFAMSTTFYTCADALPVFLQERYIFMRETAYNAYRRSSYVLSNSLVAIPSLIILSAAFAATTFFAVGLAGGLQGFGFFFLIILASFWAGSSFVTFLSGVVSNVMLGYTVVVAILAYFLLFSGFFITRDRIPVYWIWFHYLSLVKYPYEAVLHNEFGGASSQGRCFIRGSQIFDNSPLSSVPEAIKAALLKSMSTTLGMQITPQTCMTTGPDILKQQGVMDLNKWNCLWITVAWGFLFRILFYFALLLGSKNKRT